jgi:hypothetical protein
VCAGSYCGTVAGSRWPHRLLSVAVHRRLCQLMQTNSGREVVVSAMACGKYCSPASAAGERIDCNLGERPAGSKLARSTRALDEVSEVWDLAVTRSRVRHHADMYCQA